MIDTNVIISGVLFPNSRPAEFLENVFKNDTVVLCSYIIDELHRIFKMKFKEKFNDLEKFLSKFSYELVYTLLDIKSEEYPDIRDKDDLPILVSAINSDVDIIVTGDKAFFDLNIEKPEILSPGEYLQKYLDK
jgi:putative PIN family toxin of toxin-antitoxin system